MTTPIETADTVVIGAGVVGLAVARALAQAGREVIILESADQYGSGTSSRNSEVIHAGLYYAPGSNKAAWCVRGKALLYAFCESRQVAHQRCGKLLVATDVAQHGKLEALMAQGAANGVNDLERLSTAQARALEPALRCTAAVLSPSTGIIDSHGLMRALLGEAEAAGAMLALKSPVTGGVLRADGGADLHVASDPPMTLRARQVINAAGLHAPWLARQIEGLPQALIPAAGFCKGNYFACSGKPAFSRLIYPMPESDGLGVHVTLDLAGQMRFGPDVEWLAPPQGSAPFTPDYRVDPARQAGMTQAIRRYWPALPNDALSAAYAGVRPKLGDPDGGANDFLVQGASALGVPGWINLLGIESPGLTACLAIAEHVSAELQAQS